MLLAISSSSPADAEIPAPPPGFVPANGADFRGVLPKSIQLAVMGDAVAELHRFDDYAEVFGKTAPPHDAVMQSFDAANRWSVMRAKIAAWDAYCRTQEGLAWRDVRAHMARMKPAFELASTTDAELAVHYPALKKLFEAQRSIAAKAVGTRRANQKLVAEGKLPIKGAAGKRRHRAAARAALEQLANSRP